MPRREMILFALTLPLHWHSFPHGRCHLSVITANRVIELRERCRGEEDGQGITQFWMVEKEGSTRGGRRIELVKGLTLAELSSRFWCGFRPRLMRGRRKRFNMS